MQTRRFRAVCSNHTLGRESDLRGKIGRRSHRSQYCHRASGGTGRSADGTSTTRIVPRHSRLVIIPRLFLLSRMMRLGRDSLGKVKRRSSTIAADCAWRASALNSPAQLRPCSGRAWWENGWAGGCRPAGTTAGHTGPDAAGTRRCASGGAGQRWCRWCVRRQRQ